MPEQPDPAEQAFRNALRHHADDIFTLDRTSAPPTAQPRRPRRPRQAARWWTTAAAAAAAAVVLIAGTLAALDTDRGAEVSGPTARSLDDPRMGGAIAADSGWKWVSRQGVSVQVPADWGYYPGILRPQDCTRNDVSQAAPAVQSYVPWAAVEAMGCPDVGTDLQSDDPRVRAAFPDVPTAQWGTFLQFSDRSTGPDGTYRYQDWTMRLRTVGGVQLQLLTSSTDEAVADQVMGSVVAGPVDALGCETTSPIRSLDDRPMRPFDLDKIAGIEGIAICQYQGIQDTPSTTIWAARHLDSAQATQLLDQLREAPVGSGPNDPASCLGNFEVDGTLVVRIYTGAASAPYDLYVRYSACDGNGIDDGTTARTLTRDVCGALFDDPVLINGLTGATGAICPDDAWQRPNRE